MTLCKKCGSIHLYNSPCVKPQEAVKHSDVVNPPVENVKQSVAKQPIVKPLEVVKQPVDEVVKRKDRHKKTEARAEYMRNYMREYMKSRRAKIPQKNPGEPETTR